MVETVEIRTKTITMDNIKGGQQHTDSQEGVILDAYGRRRFLGVAAAASAGLFIASEEADAGLFGYSSKPVAGIPASWVRLKGKDVYRYANFVKGLGLRNITPRMVLAPHFKTRGWTTNDLPPRSCLLYTSPSPRDQRGSRMPSSA